MNNTLLTLSKMALIAALLFTGCRSLPTEDEGSETSPGGSTALAPEYRRIPSKGPVSFTHQVKPVLESKCLPCHSPPYSMNGFRLDSRDYAFARGASGPRIVPGKPEESLLLALSTAHAGVVGMPKVGNRVTPIESLILRQWILEGAHWPAGSAGDLHPRENWLEKE